MKHSAVIDDRVGSIAEKARDALRNAAKEIDHLE
ncbi:unnamed protein product [Strongylus vulgaris]|uniref:Uncharacterized protein n=1 Tax=Strongylus vulgaris TaxID=40348 RepID=A0A3P7J9U9_STRVU|nr:unnamed protein product [Strongylus vulgaris]